MGSLRKSSKGKNDPICLVHLERTDDEDDDIKLVVDQQNLDALLEKVEAVPLITIAVTGPQKTGKSLVLGYLARFLKKSAENSEDEWIGWNAKDQTLTECEWASFSGKSPDKPGIWAFNRSFLINSGESESQQQNAVLLLYIQSSEKYHWSIADNLLMGLTISVSSSLVFNVHKDIDEAYLVAVGNQVQNALRAVSQNGKNVPPKGCLQNAVFLIRDWNVPTEYSYGVDGGNRFVKEKMRETPNHSREARLSRKLVSVAFENVSGCLLPFPGSTALEATFSGSIEEMEVAFVKKLEEFIEETVNVDGENGQFSKIGSEWKAMLEERVVTLNSGCRNGVNPRDILGMMGIQHVALLSEQKEIMKMAMKAYLESWRGIDNGAESLKEKQMRDTHKKAKKRSLAKFRREVIGTRAGAEEEEDDDEDEVTIDLIDQAVEQHLKNKLEEKFEEIKANNLRAKSDALEKWIGETIEHYKESMIKTFPCRGGRIPGERQVHDESEQIIESLVTDYEEKRGTDRDTFLKRLKEAEKLVLEKLLRRKESSQSGLPEDDAMEDSVSICSEGSTVSYSSLKYDSVEENAMSSSRVGQSLSFDSGRMSFGSMAAAAVVSPATNIAQVRREEEHQKKLATTLVDNLTARFASSIIGNMNDEEMDNERIKILEQFEKEIPFPVDNKNFKQFREMLESGLNLARINVVAERNNAKKKCRATLDHAVSTGVKAYTDNLAKFLQEKESLTSDELEKAGQEMFAKQLEIFAAKFATEVEGGECLASKKEMVQKMREVFASVKKDYEESQETALEKQSTDLVTWALQQYTEKMVEQMECLKTAQEFKTQELLVKGQTIKIFKEKTKTQMSGTQAKKMSKDVLSPRLDQAFQEMLVKFELKLKGDSGSHKMAISKAKVQYNEQMENHCKNTEFIEPAELVKIHDQVVTALLICNDCQLVPEQELRAALNTAFERFEEENKMNMDGTPAIGIDLGTTFSCVSVYQKGRVTIIPNSVGKLTTPSYVLFPPEGGEVIVGEEAKTRAYENPEGTIFDAKRILGRVLTDEKLKEDIKLWPFSVVDGGDRVPKIEVNGERLPPEVISAKVLAQLKKDAEDYLKRPLTKAVITVPAYFKDGQKQATIAAGRMAGLEVTDIITEPVAAALAYKLQYSVEDKERHILVFDLGGGTFDVAILKVNAGKITVLTVDGDTHLGGEDFDRNMMEFCARKFKEQHNINLFEGKDSTVKNTKDDVRRRLRRLQAECERQKIVLNSGKSRSVIVSVERIYEDLSLDVTVSRRAFDQMNNVLFQKTIKVVDESLKNAKVEKSQIDNIVLVGGSTRIPRIQALLQEYFEGKSLDYQINPDEAVALGAGLYAAIKKGDVDKKSAAFTRVQNVTPMSIGVEVYGGGFQPIIPKGTPTPVKLQEVYKTAHNNQTSVQITIYEGEETVAKENHKLGDFYLNEIPPEVAGKENIDVEMVINEQGILHVTAKSKSTGKGRGIRVTENKQQIGEATIKRYLTEANPAA